MEARTGAAFPPSPTLQEGIPKDALQTPHPPPHCSTVRLGGLQALPHLQAHEHVEEVVHPRQVLHVLEDGHEEGGGDGDGARQQHAGKARPAQVEEALQEERGADNVGRGEKGWGGGERRAEGGT